MIANTKQTNHINTINSNHNNNRKISTKENNHQKQQQPPPLHLQEAYKGPSQALKISAQNTTTSTTFNSTPTTSTTSTTTTPTTTNDTKIKQQNQHANTETTSEINQNKIMQTRPKVSPAAASGNAPPLPATDDDRQQQQLAPRQQQSDNNLTTPSKFQQRQQKFLAAAAKCATPAHLRRPILCNGANESAWRTLPTLLARVNNNTRFYNQPPDALSKQVSATATKAPIRLNRRPSSIGRDIETSSPSVRTAFGPPSGDSTTNSTSPANRRHSLRSRPASCEPKRVTAEIAKLENQHQLQQQQRQQQHQQRTVPSDASILSRPQATGANIMTPMANVGGGRRSDCDGKAAAAGGGSGVGGGAGGNGAHNGDIMSDSDGVCDKLRDSVVAPVAGESGAQMVVEQRASTASMATAAARESGRSGGDHNQAIRHGYLANVDKSEQPPQHQPQHHRQLEQVVGRAGEKDQVRRVATAAPLDQALNQSPSSAPLTSSSSSSPTSSSVVHKASQVSAASQFYNNINLTSGNHNNNINNNHNTKSNININNNNNHHQHHHHHNHQHQHHPLHQHQHHNYISNHIQHYQELQHQQSTHQLQQHQNVMAHYKFHNDCQSSVLTYEQVKRLDFVMDQTVPIHGRGNTPTLYVKLKELIRLVKYKLHQEHSIEIRDVILNGGAASYVLAPENSHYNDLDLILSTDLSDESRFDVIRDVVLECLMEFMPKNNGCSMSSGHASGDGGANLVAHANSDGRSSNTSCLTDEDDLNEDSLRGRSRSSSSSLGSESQDSPGSDVAKSSDDDCAKDIANKTNTNCDAKFRVKSIGNAGDETIANGKQQFCENNKSEIERGAEQQQHQQQVNDQQDCDSGISGSEIANTTTPTTARAGESSENSETGSQKQMRSFSTSSQSSHHVITSQQQQQQNNIIHAYQMPLNNCTIKEAYVHKMVKVNDDDRWSLISLGVQQSEANCCCNQQQRQHQQRNSSMNNQQAQTAAASSTPLVVNCGQCASQVTSNNCTNECVGAGGQLVGGHRYQESIQCHHLKQSPNSIELKFVDRMRRKFEFSVDSFQIILDSLIQFYDYAPQSTITIQRKLANSHPSSMMINTRPLINRHRCGRCNHEQRRASFDCKTMLNNNNADDNSSCQDHKLYYQDMNDYITASKHQQQHQLKRHHQNGSSNVNHHHQHQCSSQSYYNLAFESNVSPSNSSIASSSGCSSSSSVVSSSSSSLSCDEDQEDLYCCDADSSPASSASTSSLLSSTTISMMSTTSLAGDGGGGAVGVADPRGSQKQQQNHQSEPKPDDNVTKGSQITQLNTSTSTLNNSSSINGSSQVSSKQHFKRSNNQFVVPGKVGSCDFETNKTSCAVISENFYPTVIGRSEYGNFKEALYHLEKKLIATRSPEEIRGGGLLKYCNLLVKNYKPTNVYQIRTLERYMCSRFFIDFSDLNQQRAKLESYLANHFSDDPMQKFDYLTILHNVVQRSTVCLMNHELRLTLNMIRDLAFKLNEQQVQHQQQMTTSAVQQQQQQPSAALSLQQQQQQHQLSPMPEPCNQQQAQHPQQQHQQQHYYQRQEPVVMQSGIYRVTLVNYALTKPVKS